MVRNEQSTAKVSGTDIALKNRVILVTDTLPAILQCTDHANVNHDAHTHHPPLSHPHFPNQDRVQRKNSIEHPISSSPLSSFEALKATLCPMADFVSQSLEIEGRPNNISSTIAGYLQKNVLYVGRPVGCGQFCNKTNEESNRHAIANACGNQSVPVFLEDHVIQASRDFCRLILRPLLNYILWDCDNESFLKSGPWNSYVKVNESFCDAVIRSYQPGDLIWVFDYQLFLLPAMLRTRLPDATIAFYSRLPFPSSELLRCLPEAKDILNGVLGANLVGFQTYSYARHFLSSCTRILGLESSSLIIDNGGFPVQVLIHPFGIDLPHIQRLKGSLAVSDRIKSFREVFQGKKVFLGIESVDQGRGVVHKLKTFDTFFQRHPELIGKLALVQVLYGGRNVIDSKITELASLLNSKYGSLDFHPIHLFQQTVDFDEYIALLSVADVLLITAERDTVSSTLLEFIACQDGKFGIPIIREFSGIADLLPVGAYLVNPWDYLCSAKTIAEVLDMSLDDREIQYKRYFDLLKNLSIEKFVSAFLEYTKSTRGSLELLSSPTPFLSFDTIMERYEESPFRLILLDYDGTLSPISPTPSAAIPSQELLRVLRSLTSDSRNLVYIISGRDQATLEEWLGTIPRLGLSAEHGCFLRPISDDIGEASRWITTINIDDLTWRNDVIQIMEYYTERTPKSFLECKTASVAWHYRLTDPVFGSWQAKAMQAHLEHTIASKYPVEIMNGKKNLEVRPRLSNKGEIVRALLRRHGRDNFIFCAGDDRTDEDMFRALYEELPMINLDLPEQYFTVCIGAATKKTLAKYRINSPEQLVSLLLRLSAFSAERTSGVTL